MDLVTYLGDASLKSAFLTEISTHEKADAIVKGHYGKMNGQFTGCAIGCSLRSLNLLQGKPHMEQTSQHARIPTELGWPLWLAYAEDNIFENLPDELSKTWPRRLAEAIPVGVTVPDLVLAKLLRWMLVDAHFGVIKCATTKAAKNSVLRVAALFDRTIGGEVVPESEWAARAARARAASAASVAWVAWAAMDAMDAWARAAGGAASVAWVAMAAMDAWARAAGGAASAARVAWAAGDAMDAMDAFYPALSDELLRLLSELEPSHINTTAEAVA